MSEQIILTDPARELAELCQSLCVQTGRRGDEFLADHFRVEAWSRDFFQIIFTISERCSKLQDIVDRLDLDQDVREEIKASIAEIMLAFSASGMQHPWQQDGAVRLALHNTRPIKAISGQVRQHIAYRKLSGAEIVELLESIAELLGWLEEHQLAEQDFIRQALIEGLNQLYFRLDRISWLGSGYAIESLREVIGAYMMLERGITPAENPAAEAAIKKVGTLIQKIYSKISAAKNVSETGDWLVRVYAAGSLYYQAAPTATLLLGSGGS